MTVAIGILPSGGIVIAADRQQTEGTQKVDQGKICATWSGRSAGGRRTGCLAIAGAGNGPYVDAIAVELREWFSGGDGIARNLNVVEKEIRNRHEAFYRRYVLPFAKYSEYERPDYELLMASSVSGSGSALWTSRKLVVNRQDPFAAVGVGSTTAKALLTKLWTPRLPLPIAVSLAAYVVFHVKQTVDGVGLETDIFQIHHDSFPFILSSSETLEMENQFRAYESLERANLLYCLGGNTSEAGGMKRPKLTSRQREMRKFFDKLNQTRIERLKGILPGGKSEALVRT